MDPNIATISDINNIISKQNSEYHQKLQSIDDRVTHKLLEFKSEVNDKLSGYTSEIQSHFSQVNAQISQISNQWVQNTLDVQVRLLEHSQKVTIAMVEIQQRDLIVSNFTQIEAQQMIEASISHIKICNEYVVQFLAICSNDWIFRSEKCKNSMKRAQECLSSDDDEIFF